MTLSTSSANGVGWANKTPEPSGASSVTHPSSTPWIHLNAAGASPTSDATHAAVVAHLENERTYGGYRAAALLAKDDTQPDAHNELAKLLGCDADEIAVAESAQAAWAKAFYSLQLATADTILSFEDEYAGNAVAMVQQAARTGAALEVLPMQPAGVIDVTALEKALEARSQAGGGGRVVILLTHVQTNSAIVQPAAAVGKLAGTFGATFLLDACQSFGQLPVDVRQIGCDFACGTGRKWLRAPRGTGFLYARRGALPTGAPGGAPVASLVGEPPAIDHSAARWTAARAYELQPGARRYEMWELSVANRLGLAVAVRECNRVGPARIARRSAELANRLRNGLRAIRGVEFRDGTGREEEVLRSGGGPLSAIVTFEVETACGVSADAVVECLAARGVGASVSPSTHSFDDSQWARPKCVRLSPSYFNTEGEVDAAVRAVAEAVDEALEPVPQSYTP